MSTRDEVVAFAERVGRDPTLVPKGPYCYSFTGNRIIGQDGLPRFETKVCPYWAGIAREDGSVSGFCALMMVGDDDEDGTLLLFDQVKECGIEADEG